MNRVYHGTLGEEQSPHFLNFFPDTCTCIGTLVDEFTNKQINMKYDHPS